MLVFDFMLSRIFCRDDDMPGEGSAVAGAPVALRRGDPRSQGPFRDRSKVSGWHEPNWLRRAHQNEGSLREAPVNLIKIETSKKGSRLQWRGLYRRRQGRAACYCARGYRTLCRT